MIDKPMNPYASEDFANAIKNASDELKKMGERMKEKFPFMDEPYVAFKDMNEDYCGKIRLPYSPIGAWNDVFNILATSGYTVTATVESATETEREVDGADKFIVIEYSERM